MSSITEFLNNFKINLKLKKNIYITKKTHLNYQIAKILKENNYITQVYVIKIKNNDWLVIYIDYLKNPLVTTIQKIKTFNIQVKNIFLTYNEIYKLNKTEFIILSTSKGLLSGKSAYTLKIGGKLLCSIK